MKKLFFIICALVGMNVLAYSQNVKVNINNQDATAKDDCPYRINGICSTEDIGGVDAEFKREHYGADYYDYLSLTNYNSFPVSVIWQIEEYADRYGEVLPEKDRIIRTGTTILGVEGQKKIEVSSFYGRWSIKGMIVRKLAQ